MKSMHLFRETALEILVELILSYVPIFFLALLFISKSDLGKIVGHEEWLFVSSVLLCQSIAKLLNVRFVGHGTKSKLLTLSVLAIVLLGIVPSFMAIQSHVTSPAHTPSGLQLVCMGYLVVFANCAFVWSSGVERYSKEKAAA